MRKCFPQNHLQFGHTHSKSLICPRLKNIGLKGRRIINLPEAPTCLGPALVVRRRLVFVYRLLGQPKGNCSTLETWDGWTVSPFGPMSRSLPEDRRLISHVYYKMHGSQSFLTTYQPFK